MVPNHIPDRYRGSAIPHLFVEDAAGAIAFYKKAFGAEEVFRVARPDGHIVHAEIEIGGSVVMVGDLEAPFGEPLSLHGTTVGVHVYVVDVDLLFSRAIDVGAESLQDVRDMFYGDRVGMLRDPFGHVWVLLTHLEDLEPSEIKRRGEQLLAG